MKINSKWQICFKEIEFLEEIENQSRPKIPRVNLINPKTLISAYLGPKQIQ